MENKEHKKKIQKVEAYAPLPIIDTEEDLNKQILTIKIRWFIEEYLGSNRIDFAKSIGIDPIVFVRLLKDYNINKNGIPDKYAELIVSAYPFININGLVDTAQTFFYSKKFQVAMTIKEIKEQVDDLCKKIDKLQPKKPTQRER